MKALVRYSPLALLLMFAVGCQVEHIGPTGLPTGGVTHVVVMWMNDPGDMTARNEILAAGRKLQAIPGVLSVTGGTAMHSNRPVVDSTYDVAMVFTFKSADDLQKYLDNPEHQQLKTDVLDRYVQRYVVYDFVSK